ncbi:MAG: hypothetical protein ACU84J_13685 [Gammaproteobacteria bacterium]
MAPFNGFAAGCRLIPGMTVASVTALHGRPDKIFMLEGKDLIEMAEDSVKSSAHKIAYVYHHDNLQVWFSNGIVTGMTVNGLAIQEYRMDESAGRCGEGS